MLPAPPRPVASYACAACDRRVAAKVARCPSCFAIAGFRPSHEPPHTARFVLPGAPRYGRTPFGLGPFGAGAGAFGAGAFGGPSLSERSAFDMPRYTPPPDPETRPLRVPPGVAAIALSRRCEIPAKAAITQTFAFLGMRGSGKTYACSVMVEDMIEEGEAQVIVIDPLDAMWGLARNADNSGPSALRLHVYGSDETGEPLAPDSGRAMARKIITTQDSFLFSLAGMRGDEQVTFVADLVEELYFLQHTRGTPIHLVIDEADLYAPQAGADDEQKRARNAIEDVWRRGRKRGFGGSMLTQRPSSITKNVLTQTEVLVVGRLAAPQDLDAVELWVTTNDDAMAWPRMKSALPSMKKGTMVLRSPAWLEAVRRIAVRPKRTFDSSSTPGAKTNGAPLALRPPPGPPTVGTMPPNVPNGSGPASEGEAEALDFDLDDLDDGDDFDLDDDDDHGDDPDPTFNLHDDDPSSGETS